MKRLVGLGIRLRHLQRQSIALLIALFFISLTAAAQTTSDPLPSWHDGAAKQRIIDFVTRVTKESGPDFVPPSDRISTFDNDGRLWIEQPIYTEFAFTFD